MAAPTFGRYLVSQLYADDPVAWDGAGQLLYVSSTNNCRYYGVTATPLAEMEFTPGWGFTTTSTSNNPYPTALPFVHPGIVPTFQYDSSTAKYSVVVLGVEGTVITELSSTPFPSQDFGNGGFLRIMLGFNDDPVLHFYGHASSTRTCWTATVDPSGQLSPITQVGGTFTIAGNPYLDGMTHPFSDRFAFYPNQWLAFDRLNPKVPIDLKPKLPATPGMVSTWDKYYAEPVRNPGRLFIVRKSSSAVRAPSVVLDVQVAEDASTLTVVNTWNVPTDHGGTLVTALPDGKVVASVGTPVDWGPADAYYDIFGSPKVLGPLSTSTNYKMATFDAGFVTNGYQASYNEHNIVAWKPEPAYVPDPVRRIFSS